MKKTKKKVSPAASKHKKHPNERASARVTSWSGQRFVLKHIICRRKPKKTLCSRKAKRGTASTKIKATKVKITQGAVSKVEDFVKDGGYEVTIPLLPQWQEGSPSEHKLCSPQSCEKKVTAVSRSDIMKRSKVCFKAQHSQMLTEGIGVGFAQKPFGEKCNGSHKRHFWLTKKLQQTLPLVKVTNSSQKGRFHFPSQPMICLCKTSG